MNTADSPNPYESPQHASRAAPQLPENRPAAVRAIRIAVAVLFIPALVNVSGLYTPRFRLLVYVESVWIAILSLAIVFWGIRVLDWVAELIRRFFGSGITRHSWLESMYASLWPLPHAATLGAVVWLIWSAVFFGTPGGNTVTVCFVFGTIGHLLGASVYLNVFYGWYKLSRTRTTP